MMSVDKSERYLKEIANNTAEIAKELKKMNRKSVGNDKNDPEFERIRDALNSAPSNSEWHPIRTQQP